MADEKYLKELQSDYLEELEVLKEIVPDNIMSWLKSMVNADYDKLNVGVGYILALKDMKVNTGNLVCLIQQLRVELEPEHRQSEI